MNKKERFIDYEPEYLILKTKIKNYENAIKKNNKKFKKDLSFKDYIFFSGIHSSQKKSVDIEKYILKKIGADRVSSKENKGDGITKKDSFGMKSGKSIEIKYTWNKKCSK